MSRTTILLGAIVTLGLAACSDPTAPDPAASSALAIAKPAVCATATVTNNPQVVVNQVMPPVRYTLTNCGTRRLTVTVSMYETFGPLSGLCLAPMPAPVSITISSGKRLSLSFPTYRSPCGYVDSIQQGIIVPSTNSWQDHRLMVSVRNAADNTLLSTSPFQWHDTP